MEEHLDADWTSYDTRPPPASFIGFKRQQRSLVFNVSVCVCSWMLFLAKINPSLNPCSYFSSLGPHWSFLELFISIFNHFGFEALSPDSLRFIKRFEEFFPISEPLWPALNSHLSATGGVICAIITNITAGKTWWDAGWGLKRIFIKAK